MEKNLTSGSVFKTILGFSLPFLLSNFLQTLYGMADLFIIGQFNGVESTTAVSIGSQVMHMITVMIVGIAMGTTVVIGICMGANDKKKMSLAVGNTVTLFTIISVAITVILLCFVNVITRVMCTPQEAVNGTVQYLTVCFIGIPFITAYNIISAIFRGMGDSKSPMYFVAVACVINIILDVIFIGGLGLGPMGAALGTTISQTLSVIVALIAISRKENGLKISKACLKPDKNVMKEILKVGIPVSLQDGFIQISFIIITIFANRRGLNDAAAVGIVEKIISVIFLVPSSMLSSVSSLTAQNIGAKKHGRAKETLGYAITICVIFGVAASVFMVLFAEPVVGIFTNDQISVSMGSQYLRGYVWDCIFAGIHFCFSGYFCAYGLSGISFIHNCLSILCARIPLSYYASVHYKDTLFPMGIASPAGSALSVVICIAAFVWMCKKGINRVEIQ